MTNIVYTPKGVQRRKGDIGKTPMATESGEENEESEDKAKISGRRCEILPGDLVDFPFKSDIGSGQTDDGKEKEAEVGNITPQKEKPYDRYPEIDDAKVPETGKMAPKIAKSAYIRTPPKKGAQHVAQEKATSSGLTCSPLIRREEERKRLLLEKQSQCVCERDTYGEKSESKKRATSINKEIVRKRVRYRQVLRKADPS